MHKSLITAVISLIVVVVIAGAAFFLWQEVAEETPPASVPMASESPARTAPDASAEREQQSTASTAAPKPESVQPSSEPAEREPAAAAQPAAERPAKQAAEQTPRAATSTGQPEADARSQAKLAALPPGAPAPSFDVVRIARDGHAVIAGRAPANATVTVLDGEQVLATVDADSRGEWAVIIDKSLAAGARELRLVATLADGSTVSSQAPVVLIVPERPEGAAEPGEGKTGTGVLAVQLPSAPKQASRLLQRPVPRGGAAGLSLDTIDYDAAGNVVISGTAPRGSAVRTYLNNQALGDVIASDQNAWQFTPSQQIAAGTHSLRVDQVAPDGKVISRIELPFQRVDPERAAAIVAEAGLSRVIVQPGNSLWRIARRAYGRGVEYTVIFEANKDQIRDPHWIYPGQIFDIPER